MEYQFNDGQLGPRVLKFGEFHFTDKSIYLGYGVGLSLHGVDCNGIIRLATRGIVNYCGACIGNYS